MGQYRHTLPPDATTLVLQKCPTISEQVVVIFMAYKVTNATVQSVEIP